MNRLSAGLITGAIGAALLVALSFVQIQFIGLLIPILVGIGAGVLVARNPKFAGKTGHAGALAGLLAGALLLAGSLVAGVILINTPNGTFDQVIQKAAPTLTAAAGNNGGGSPGADVTSVIKGVFIFGFCIAGALYLGISTGIGAAAGAIAGNKNQPPPAQAWTYPTPQQPGMPPQPGYPPQAGYPQQPGYPPQQPGYGTQQPGYPPPAPPADGTR